MEDKEPVERETTIIQTGDRGGGGLIAAIVLLAVVAIFAFLYFNGTFEKAGDEIGVNVNVEAPNVELPDIKIETPPPANPPANSN